MLHTIIVQAAAQCYRAISACVCVHAMRPSAAWCSTLLWQQLWGTRGDVL